MDPSEHTHPHTDGTGAGLLRFCAWLGDQGLVASEQAHSLHLAVRRVLGATDDWEHLDIRALDLERAVRRFDASDTSPLQPRSRVTYKSNLRTAVRLYLAYLHDPASFRMPPPAHQAATPASTPPCDDGTAASLVGFCRWLGEQRLVSARRADQLRQAVRRVLDPDHDWERYDVRNLDIDGLLQRLATATTPPLRPSTLYFYSSNLRRAVHLYLTYLDNPTGFHTTGTVITRWHNPTVPGAAGVPAHHPAAAGFPTISYPFPLRGPHTIWLRLPADLTRHEAHRLATFIHALAMDAQPPPGNRPGGHSGQPPHAGGRTPNLSAAAQAILLTPAEHPNTPSPISPARRNRPFHPAMASCPALSGKDW